MPVTVSWLLTLLFSLEALASSDPCSIYEAVTTGGYRSSDFNSLSSPISLCDSDYIRTDFWYRFDLDAGIRLKEGLVPLWHCGTQAPIWLDGTHPTDGNPVSINVCATGEPGMDFWTDNVTIQMCNDSLEIFYVYQLANPPGCPMAYCVDAATRKECQPPLIWIEDEFRCGENVTKPPTTPPPPTVPYVPTTLPPGYTGWTSWGPWSTCSKPCDYGLQTRKRTCAQVPCSGEAVDSQTCNEYNCNEVDEEKDKGIVLKFRSAEDTMLQVVKTEEDVRQIVRDSLNVQCLSDASMCCGRPIEEVVTPDTIFITYDGIRNPQGFPQTVKDGSVAQKMIAVVAEDVNSKICLHTATRLFRRHSSETEPNYISYDVMHIAVSKSQEQIYQSTGLTIDAYMHPEEWHNVNEPTQPTESPESCPVTTCIIPIVCGILAAAVLTIVIIVVYKYTQLKKRLKRTEPHPPPPYPTEWHADEDAHHGVAGQTMVPVYEVPYYASGPYSGRKC